MKYTYIFIIFISSCNYSTKETSINHSYWDSENRLIASGNLSQDGLQDGYWEYFSDDSISASGKFIKGRLFGRWSYNLLDFKGYIDWDTITVLGNVGINYPNDFTHNLNDGRNFTLSNKDTYIKFYLTNEESDDIIHENEESFYSKGFILNKNKYESYISNNNKIYTHFNDISKGDTMGLNYLTIVSVDSYRVVIVLEDYNFNAMNYQKLISIYLDIINNMFIDNKKLLDPLNVNNL